MSNEELNKSIDALIDELFTEEEFEKAIPMGVGDASETADEGKKPEKGMDDSSGGRGRPKEISDVPDNDMDGSRAKGYDAIMGNQAETENKETSQTTGAVKNAYNPKKGKKGKTPPGNPMKKSFEISEDEYAEYLELKKSDEEREMNELRKAFISEQKDLIKSAVSEATQVIRNENEGLRKSLNEQTELVKAMAKKPQVSKSITSVQAFEKSQSAPQKTGYFSKSEMLDVAEDLFKSGKLRDSHVIELDNNGFIYDNNARQILEDELRRR